MSAQAYLAALKAKLEDSERQFWATHALYCHGVSCWLCTTRLEVMAAQPRLDQLETDPGPLDASVP